MSWAEVKKINSNINVPLDKLINKQNLKFLNVKNDSVSSPFNQNIISVNGKGAVSQLSITFPLATSEKWRNVSINISVDGATYLQKSFTTNYANGSSTRWILCKRSNLVLDPNSRATTFHIFSNPEKYTNGTGVMVGYINGNQYSSVTNGINSTITVPSDAVALAPFYELIDGDVLFNSSLVVNITASGGTSGNYNAEMEYTLLD